MDYQASAVQRLYKAYFFCTREIELWQLEQIWETQRKDSEIPKQEKTKYIQVRRGYPSQVLWKAFFPLRSLYSFHWCTAPRESMSRWVFCFFFFFLLSLASSVIYWYYEELWLQQECWTKLIELNFFFSLACCLTSCPCCSVFLSVKCFRYF